MVSVIFERKYYESCYGGASMEAFCRYILTENSDYPTTSVSERADEDDEQSSHICLDRKVCGVFDSVKEARQYVLAFESTESTSYLGAEYQRQLERYPDSMVLGGAPFSDGRTKDGEAFGKEQLPTGFAVHVANNSMSPFWFTDEKDAEAFMTAIRKY